MSVRNIKNTLRKRRAFQKSETLDLALLELRDAGYVRLNAPVRDESSNPFSGVTILLHPNMLREGSEEQEE